MSSKIIPIRVFVAELCSRSPRERAISQSVLDLLVSLGAEVVTGTETERQVGSLSARLALLDSADAIVVVRTGRNEAAAFEAGYNLLGGTKAPLFLADWKQAREHSERWQELGAEYGTFREVDELREPLAAFLGKIAERHRRRDRRMLRLMEELVA